MKVTYVTRKLEKLFSDSSKLRSALDPAWIKIIASQVASLKAAERFADFLSLRLWRPEQLQGAYRGHWALHISPNARMILKPNSDDNSVMMCTEIQVKGVCDYHGDKSNWYIP